MSSEEEISSIKRRYSGELLSQPGVCGVGVERDEAGEYVLIIHLDTDDPGIRQRLPHQIEGHPVKFVRSGPFRTLLEKDRAESES